MNEPGPRLRIAVWWMPELLFFADDQQRREAVQRAKKKAFQGPKGWIGVAVLVGTVMLICQLADRWLVPPGINGSLLGRVLASSLIGFVCGTALGLVLGWLQLNRLRADIRQQLLDAGVAVCLGCGYDLRGQTEPRCPECGQPFDPVILEGLPRNGEE